MWEWQALAIVLCIKYHDKFYLTEKILRKEGNFLDAPSSHQNGR